MVWVLKALLRWAPDFDIDATALPELPDGFPTQADDDALGNATEWVLGPVPGLTLVDASVLTLVVAGHPPGMLALHAGISSQVLFHLDGIVVVFWCALHCKPLIELCGNYPLYDTTLPRMKGGRGAGVPLPVPMSQK